MRRTEGADSDVRVVILWVLGAVIVFIVVAAVGWASLRPIRPSDIKLPRNCNVHDRLCGPEDLKPRR